MAHSRFFNDPESVRTLQEVQNYKPSQYNSLCTREERKDIWQQAGLRHSKQEFYESGHQCVHYWYWQGRIEFSMVCLRIFTDEFT